MDKIVTQEIRVPVTKLKPGPYQHRTHFDREKMAEMVESIRAIGVINPPVVFKENGHYEILTGERRWRASAALLLSTQKDGISLSSALDLVCCEEAPQAIAEEPILEKLTMTVRVISGDKDKALHLAAIVENGQRQDLNPIEEALDYHSLRVAHKWSAEKIGSVVGKSGQHVRGRLELLKLEPAIQELVARGTLSKDPKATEALLSIPDSKTRVELAKRLAARKASIRVIQHSCQSAVTLLARNQEKPETVSPKKGEKVHVAKVRIVKKPVLAEIHSDLCLCGNCAETVHALVEELCPGCRINGLSGKCQGCPGLVEVVETLRRYVDKAVPLYVGDAAAIPQVSYDDDLEELAA